MSKKLNYAKRYTLTNVIKNGSFENGWADWWHETNTTIINNGKFNNKSAKSNTILSNTFAGISQLTDKIDVTNHKFYMSLYIKNTNIDKGAWYYPIANKPHSLLLWFEGIGNTDGKWKHYTTIQNSLGDLDTFYIYSYETSSQFDGLLLTDLTSTFGPGNEPTKTWCDNNIDFFEGSTTIWK